MCVWFREGSVKGIRSKYLNDWIHPNEGVRTRMRDNSIFPFSRNKYSTEKKPDSSNYIIFPIRWSDFSHSCTDVGTRHIFLN